jgi:molybdopterin synthase catalytic subunit
VSYRLLAIGPNRLDVQALIGAVTQAAGGGVGGVDLFVGLVRNENLGRRVVRLEYEAYEPLALAVFERIASEAAAHWPSARVGIHHRTGALVVGDASVAIVAASPHRADAFAACRYIIERVKQIAPIWKREFFEGGDAWIEGASADPDDASARQEALRRACA